MVYPRSVSDVLERDTRIIDRLLREAYQLRARIQELESELSMANPVDGHGSVDLVRCPHGLLWEWECWECDADRE